MVPSIPANITNLSGGKQGNTLMIQAIERFVNFFEHFVKFLVQRFWYCKSLKFIYSIKIFQMHLSVLEKKWRNYFPIRYSVLSEQLRHFPYLKQMAYGWPFPETLRLMFEVRDNSEATG